MRVFLICMFCAFLIMWASQIYDVWPYQENRTRRYLFFSVALFLSTIALFVMSSV